MKNTFKNIAVMLSATVVLLFAVSLGQQAQAQGGAAHDYLNSTSDIVGDTLDIPGEGIYLHSDYADGSLDGTCDLYVVLKGACASPMLLSLTVESFDIDSSDMVYVYDGMSTSAPLLYAGNNVVNPLAGNYIIFPSGLNTSGALTVRFKKTNPAKSGRGFNFQVMCRMPCETPTPHIDSVFYKLRDGVVTDTVKTVLSTMTDTTILVDVNGDTTYRLDTVSFRAVNLCVGDQLMLRAYGTYTNEHGLYNPMDVTTTFNWDFGNGDTLVGLDATDALITYRDLDCYDVVLTLLDEQGCPSAIYESVRVRLAQMPIKTIYDLATICNVDSVLVNVGYEGENGAITLRKIEFAQMKSKTNQIRKFIPDGPNCPALGTCFTAPVVFNEFPNGRTVTSAADICSICVNYEHTFMGDYTMAIFCPNGQSTRLKRKDGGGLFTGFPLDGSPWDASSGDPVCDSLSNPYGMGLDYCFSRNGAYKLVDGLYAGDESTTTDDAMLNNATPSGWVIDSTVTYPVIPAPFLLAGQSQGEQTVRTARPSKHEAKLDYYKPDTVFTPLVGCPLNGTWYIEVCDTWGIDNGWIFNWSLDICGISAGGGCKYQVGLDSVIWRPDSAYGDFDNLKYRGAIVKNVDSVNSYIMSPDTAGTFPLLVSIYDEFGCRWDTTCSITTVWTPTPELGADTVLCSVDTIQLNAADRHTASQNQSFMWEPMGQDTPTIFTKTGTNTSTLYTVEITNAMEDIRCRTRDSIRVEVHEQPSPNFDAGTYPLEGCEPYILNINNTSVGGDVYHWDFGDGDTSNVKSPSHVYAAGVYNFKYLVSSNNGCRDSLVYDSLITVYPSTKAKFSWDPINPTVLHPTVQFENRTQPQSDKNQYYWEIQYDRDNPISYHTLTDVNPSFTWTTDGEDISGSYVARLIAKTATRGPSGEMVECRDTVENKIMLVNDFLQFPNVVTPNGDGINDKFVIKNLVEGQGYPNNSLAIYNRWGKRVYFKENISDEKDFWDPAIENMPAGTYFWRFSGKGYLGNIERTGTVELLVK